MFSSEGLPRLLSLETWDDRTCIIAVVSSGALIPLKSLEIDPDTISKRLCDADLRGEASPIEVACEEFMSFVSLEFHISTVADFQAFGGSSPPALGNGP